MDAQEKVFKVDEETKAVAMRVMIGIPAYEEEENIGRLLEVLLHDCSNDVEVICVVSSGSKDKTDKIVECYSRKNSKTHLIVEKERKGKATAINKLLNELERYEALICMGADNLPEKGAIGALIDCLRKDDVSAVGGRPISVNAENTLTGFFAHLQWSLHHLISLESPKLSGELMAFKRGVIRELPPTIINDDLYVQTVLELKGLRTEYCPKAEVYLKGPNTISDFIKQRRRVFVGHKQVEWLIGRKIHTMRLPKWSLILRACPFTGLKGRVYALLFVFFQALAYLIASWDFYQKKLPYKWDMAKTTKTLN